MRRNHIDVQRTMGRCLLLSPGTQLPRPHHISARSVADRQISVVLALLPFFRGSHEAAEASSKSAK
jgi:hypothetical protein